MGALIASLLSIAPVIIGPTIKAVEALFGPKTGETKMKAVIEAVTPVIHKLGPIHLGLWLARWRPR